MLVFHRQEIPVHMNRKINSFERFIGALTRSVSLFIFSLICLGLVFATDARAAGSPLTDANPMRMPVVGDYGLRILSPTLLELTDINTAAQNTASVTDWNFVANNTFSAPPTSEFTVTVNGQTVGVQSVGFK